MLKPIETRYKGRRFRSRAEARWAVFFDTLGMGWEYEPEGYNLGNIWYLPDFRLDEGVWFEVKGERLDHALVKGINGHNYIFHPDWLKITALAQESGEAILIAYGAPNYETYQIQYIEYNADRENSWSCDYTEPTNDSLLRFEQVGLRDDTGYEPYYRRQDYRPFNVSFKRSVLHAYYAAVAARFDRR